MKMASSDVGAIPPMLTGVVSTNVLRIGTPGDEEED